MSDDPSLEAPYQWFAARDEVERLASRFYDLMEEQEPELRDMHRLDSNGKVAANSRERFALFLVGWLGGPQEYMAEHGHPRLRMRHAGVAVNTNARDAWMRCMNCALDEAMTRNSGVTQQRAQFLRQRFSEVADFMRNQKH